MSQVMAEFREQFNEAPPQRVTMLNWGKRAFARVNVKARPRSGRKTARGNVQQLPLALNIPQLS